MLLRLASLAPLALAACADAVPDDPTWAEDVAPILAANCVRCHADPPLGAAPDGFRLDVFGVTEPEPHRFVLGAGAMARSIAARVVDRSMPPDFPLSKRQIEILQNWVPAEGLPQVGGRADNTLPSVRITAGDVTADGFVELAYDLDDADDDLVVGTLEARGPADLVIARDVRSGRGTARWDVAAAPEGRYALVARVDDGDGFVDLEGGGFTVSHPGGAAPTVAVELPTSPDDGSHQPLLTDADSPYTLALAVADADGDALDVVVEAVRGDQVVAIADAEPGTAGVQWDLTAVPAGDGWRVRVTASDGTFERIATSLPFSIGHGTTALRYADVGTIFEAYCQGCHLGSDSPDAALLDFAFGQYEDGEKTTGVFNARGRIYRRAVLQRNMPPISGELLYAVPRMTDADRATLAEWLLAGAPQ